MANPYGGFFVQSRSWNDFLTGEKCVSSNQKSAVKINHSVRKRVHVVVGASSIFIYRSLSGFHRFTLVFSKISYKPQTMAESSKKFIALGKPFEVCIQEQQKKIYFYKFLLITLMRSSMFEKICTLNRDWRLLEE